MRRFAQVIGLAVTLGALGACGKPVTDFVCIPTGQRAVKPDPNPVFAKRPHDETRSIEVERHTCTNGRDMWLRPTEE